MTQSFKKRLQASSRKAMTAMREEALHRQFMVGSHTKIRLRKALSITNRLDLLDVTLLSKEVRTSHAQKMAKRFIGKLKSRSIALKSSKQSGKTAQSNFRFITLIDSVTRLSADVAIKKVIEFKSSVEELLLHHPKIWMLGAIECEVINMEMMRKIKLDNTDSEAEARKLNVCESMISRLKPNDQALNVFFLIHFHGIVQSNSTLDLDLFLKSITSKAKWKREPRQFQAKSLSKEFNKQTKAAEDNLQDIAQYITKGGNDWIKRQSYLRYKLSFDQERDMSEDAWIAKEWRRNEILRQEHAEEGIVDSLSMTPYEITQLAILIDKMMALNKSRTGYWIDSVQFRKLSTTAAYKNRDRISTLF